MWHRAGKVVISSCDLPTQSLWICSLQDLLKKLIERASDTETKVFFYKMMGDYHRYLSEVDPSQGESTGHKNMAQVVMVWTLPVSDIKDSSEKAYKSAFDECSEMIACHPIRLGLALNFSVFYYEIMKDPKKAIEMAKKVGLCRTITSGLLRPTIASWIVY